MIVPIKQCVLNVQKKTLYIKRRHEIGIEIMDIALNVKKNKLMGQEKTCVECRAKNAEKAELKRELDRESYNNSISSYHKSLYDRRKEQGLCPVCGKTNKEKRYVTCNNCRNKKNSRTKPKTLKDEREKVGLCIWCDRPVKDGYKICEIHYQMNCEKAKKANRDYLRKSNKALFIKY